MKTSLLDRSHRLAHSPFTRIGMCYQVTGGTERTSFGCSMGSWRLLPIGRPSSKCSNAKTVRTDRTLISCVSESKNRTECEYCTYTL